MFKFFAYLSRMKYIRRWALMRSKNEENILEHTQEVVFLSHALCEIGNKYFNKNYDILKAVLIASYHEVSEVITGDLPTPIKYFNPEIKKAYKDIEKIADVKILSMLPKDMQENYKNYILPNTESQEYKMVKWADRLSAYLKCVEEVKCSNNEFKKALESIESQLKNSGVEEIDYFLKEFAPAYKLTLDELD